MSSLQTRSDFALEIRIKKEKIDIDKMQFKITLFLSRNRIKPVAFEVKETNTTRFLFHFSLFQGFATVHFCSHFYIVLYSSHFQCIVRLHAIHLHCGSSKNELFMTKRLICCHEKIKVNRKSREHRKEQFKNGNASCELNKKAAFIQLFVI